MKNAFLIPLFFLLSTAVFAQPTTEWGLTVRAGNFTLPKKGPGPQPAGFTHSDNMLSAGFSTGLGIFSKIHIRPKWGLSAELLYTVSAYTLREQYNYDPQFEQYLLIENDWQQRFREQRLMLPFKVYFNCGRAAKTVLSLGIAPAFSLKTRQEVSSALPNPEIYASLYRERAYFFQYQNLIQATPRTQLFVAASVYERITSRTSVGLEWTSGLYENDLNGHFAAYGDKTYPGSAPFFMKSLSVSLQHSFFQ